MSDKKQQIRDIFDKWKVPIGQKDVWLVQGTPVVYHKALERLATAMEVKWEKPQIIRGERDEAVLLVCGTVEGKLEWSIGEALVGVNYRVSGKQAAYVYAMAEKRAKDRVILKLAEIEAHSEEEAEEFKQAAPRRGPEDDVDDRSTEGYTTGPTVEITGDGTGATMVAALDPADPVSADVYDIVESLKRAIDQCGSTKAIDDVVTSPDNAEKIRHLPSGPYVEMIVHTMRRRITVGKTINAITDMMLSAPTQKLLEKLPEAERDAIRDFAKERLVDLGWPTKKSA